MKKLIILFLLLFVPLMFCCIIPLQIYNIKSNQSVTSPATSTTSTIRNITITVEEINTNTQSSISSSQSSSRPETNGLGMAR